MIMINRYPWLSINHYHIYYSYLYLVQKIAYLLSIIKKGLGISL